PPPVRGRSGRSGRDGSSQGGTSSYRLCGSLDRETPPAATVSERVHSADGSGGCPESRSGTDRAAATRSTPRECATRSASPNTTSTAMASVGAPPTKLNATPAPSSAPRIVSTAEASNHRLKNCSASDDSPG